MPRSKVWILLHNKFNEARFPFSVSSYLPIVRLHENELHDLLLPFQHQSVVLSRCYDGLFVA